MCSDSNSSAHFRKTEICPDLKSSTSCRKTEKRRKPHTPWMEKRRRCVRTTHTPFIAKRRRCVRTSHLPSIAQRRRYVRNVRLPHVEGRRKYVRTVSLPPAAERRRSVGHHIFRLRKSDGNASGHRYSVHCRKTEIYPDVSSFVHCEMYPDSQIHLRAINLVVFRNAGHSPSHSAELQLSGVMVEGGSLRGIRL
jgi:hypothetical protein